MERHARHRNGCATGLASSSKRDIDELRRSLGIVEKELVEIAHAIEKQHVGILRFDAQILLHHRRVGGKIGRGQGVRLSRSDRLSEEKPRPKVSLILLYLRRTAYSLQSMISDSELLTLASDVGVHLTASRRTLVTAESCTGGWIGKACTDVAGSSAWFAGGAIIYSNELKQRVLHVAGGLLARHGAVSEATVRAMAEGALT